MKKIFTLNLCILLLLLISCSDNSDNGVSDPIDPNASWLIPQSEVFDGGPGKDGIPSIDNPQFTNVPSVDFMDDDELIVTILQGTVSRAYPHKILDWHEIVNDEMGNALIALNYCPLTGTGMAWDRQIDGQETTFGVSGLLYNSNIIPYDRSSDSNWSQMENLCVNGERKGATPEYYTTVEMPYGLFKELYPDGWVMNLETGFERNYATYPYGSYRTNSQLIFPVNNSDDRFSLKKRVLGVITDSETKAYTFESFSGDAIQVVEDMVGLEEIVVVGSEGLNFMTAFNRTFNGNTLSFTPLQNQYPAVMIDNEGTSWDALGVGIEGPNRGLRLTPPINYIGYWFAWAAFNPDILVY